jgi:hypothetical protein
LYKASTTDPGRYRLAGGSAREEAGGSARQRHSGDTLERSEPRRTSIRAGGHERRADDVVRSEGHSGGPCEAARALRWLPIEGRFPSRSGGSGGGAATAWTARVQTGIGGGDVLRGEPQECCRAGGRARFARLEGPALRGSARRKASEAESNVRGAMGRGWQPGARSGRARLRHRSLDALPSSKVLKGIKPHERWLRGSKEGPARQEAALGSAPAVTGDALRRRGSAGSGGSDRRGQRDLKTFHLPDQGVRLRRAGDRGCPHASGFGLAGARRRE